MKEKVGRRVEGPGARKTPPCHTPCEQPRPVVRREDLFQPIHHGQIARISFERGVGRRQKPAPEGFIVQHLFVSECLFAETVRRKEFRQRGRVDVGVAYGAVVGPKFLIQCFVIPQKWRGVRAPGVPHQNDPTVRLQDSREFALGSRHIKPVKCLPANHVIDALGR
jgi:hypothetical protein